MLNTGARDNEKEKSQGGECKVGGGQKCNS